MGKHHNSEKKIELQPKEQTELPPKKIISSKQFIQKLKSEVKGISENVLNAFISISPKLDTEENYRKVWNSTFKRK